MMNDYFLLLRQLNQSPLSSAVTIDPYCDCQECQAEKTTQ